MGKATLFIWLSFLEISDASGALRNTSAFGVQASPNPGFLVSGERRYDCAIAAGVKSACGVRWKAGVSSIITSSPKDVFWTCSNGKAGTRRCSWKPPQYAMIDAAVWSKVDRLKEKRMT